MACSFKYTIYNYVDNNVLKSLTVNSTPNFNLVNTDMYHYMNRLKGVSKRNVNVLTIYLKWIF